MKKLKNENTEPIDHLIDVFLEEVLTGRKPPDLTARILAAHRARGDAPESNALSHDEATAAMVDRAETEEVLGPALVMATPIRSGNEATPSPAIATSVNASPVRERYAAVEPRKRRNSNSTSPAYRSWMSALLAVSAAGLLIVVGWYRGRGWEIVGIDSPNAPGVAAGNSDLPTGEKPAVDSPAIANAAPPKPPAPDKVEIELDDLPFKPSTQDLAVDSLPTPAESDLIAPLASEVVVAEINDRLTQLWSTLGVKPTPEQPAVERLKNTLVTLSGQLPDEATMAAMIREGRFTVEQLLARDLQSGQFGRHWARLWMSEWLPASSLQTGPAAEFHQWLSTQINQQRPWNEIARQVLAVELPKEKGSVAAPPAYFISALAGDENRRLVETVGSSFLNTKMNCVRCHDARSLPEGSHGDQAAYWSLVALLKGIDAEGDLNAGTRWGFDLQSELFADGASPSVFFDRPDGLLKSAEARLPNGQTWHAVDASSPRVALANWISQSDRFSEATVNEVWSFVFGRPLVPQTLNIENASHSERAELLRFLAQQFRANDYDMPQLVQWVVSSRAFAMQSVQMDRGRWLSLSQQELDAYQLSELVFAAGPTLGREQASSFESSLELVVEWNKNLGRVETLAQPDLPTTLDAQSNQSAREPATSYLLHATRPTQAQRTFVTRLLRANLRWEERVEHVVGLCDETVDMQRVQHLARMLLEQSNGDDKNALLHLLWCVQQQGGT